MAMVPPSPGVARDPPRTSRNIGWPRARIEQLKTFWRENRLSTWQMAKQLGISRNALLGKVHRLGLPTHKTLASARKPIPPLKKIPPPPPVIPIVDKPVPPPPEFLGVPFLKLRPSSCRYPQGEAAPYLFCGQRRQDGSAYCPYHHRLTHTPVSSRRAELIPPPWSDTRPWGRA